ncbi:Ig-like domain-containing protein [Enterovibrio norvegicus]|uniref:Ig-like domain-containing protein n=1 Tax=Enterovibrio norvegicus TaxID=188144 RepID=UPI00352C2D46
MMVDKCMKRCQALILFILLLTFQSFVYAEIIEYRFNSVLNEQRIEQSDRKQLNPINSIEVIVSGGLDRKLKLVVEDNQGVRFSHVSGFITVDDRIELNGSAIYGKSFVVPKLPDGHYSFKQHLLDASETILKTDTKQVLIDTTPPSAGAMSWHRNSYSPHGSLDAFGYSGASKWLKLSNVSDLNGVENVEFFVEVGNVTHSLVARFNAEEKTATVDTHAAVSPSRVPDRGNYKIGFVVSDKAGNTTMVERFSHIDNVMPDVVIEVFNTSTSSWENYAAGMQIHSNPVKMRWRREKADHVAFNGSAYGWNDTDYNNQDSIYLNKEITFSYPQLYSYFNLYTKAGMVSRHYLPGYKFTLAPGVIKAPTPLGLDHHIANSGWVNSHTVRSNVAFTVDTVRIRAETRSYNQTAWLSGGGSCSIPVGQTSCQINVSISRSSGRGYTPYSYGVSDTSGTLRVHKAYLYVFHDLNKPMITNTHFDPATRTMTMRAIDYDTVQDWRSSMWVTNDFEVELVSKTNGQKYIVKPNEVEVLDYRSRSASFSLDFLDDDEYNAVFIARDSYGNEARSSLADAAAVDNTGPSISLYNNEQRLINGELVKGLEALSVRLEDANSARIKKIGLTGGPAGDTVELDWNVISEGEFGLEYPVIFPNLGEDEDYILTITASDRYNNDSVEEYSFRYEPNNLIRLKKTILMSSNTILLDERDQPYAFVDSERLRTAEGNLASGMQRLFITVRSDGAFSLDFAGLKVEPGETKQLDINIDETNGRLYIPISTVDGSAGGESEFMFEIYKLQ